MVKKNNNKRLVGDIVKIPLGDGSFAFGQLLPSPLVAFFNMRRNEIPPLYDILKTDVIFTICVMNYVITDGDWPKIGHSEVSQKLNQKPKFFKKDPLSGRFFITFTGAEEILATKMEVEGLEYAAVWEPSHVIDRLNDHFAGRPNKWVNSMKP